MVKALADLPKNVWKSIFRNPLPSSDRGRAATSFTNFFLHIQPVRVSKQALRPSYTMGLGLISFFLFRHSDGDRRTADVLLRAVDHAGLRQNAGPAQFGCVRHHPAQHASLGRARDGGGGVSAHVPRVSDGRRTSRRASSTG